MFNQSSERIALVFVWLSPLVATIFATKLAKLLLWKPKLPTGVNLGEGLKTSFAVEASTAVVHSALGAILVLLLALETARRIWFRTRSALWVPVIGAGAFVLAKLLWAARTGSLSFTDSSLLAQAGSEYRFLLSLFRSDLLLVLVVAWVAIGLDRAFRSRLGRRWAWTIWLQAPALLVLGLELAYFRKTGLNGTGEVLGFLLRDTVGMRALAGSELDWQSALCVVLPLLFLFIVFRLLRRRQDPASRGRSSSAAFGIAFLVFATILAASPVDRPSPVYARYVRSTLVRLADDALVRPIRTGEWNRSARSMAETGRPLFDPRLVTRASTAPKRNVVVVMLESVRAASTGLYAPGLDNTPFLRELAAKGARVDEMYAVAPRTSSAWVSILAGLYPGDSDTQFLWGSLEEKSPRASSLARVLRSYSYRSAFFLPTHLRLQNDEQLARNLGFDELVYEHTDEKGKPVQDALFHRGTFERLSYFGYEDRILLDPIKAWVNRQSRDGAPFLLALMTNAGHYPYEPPKAWKPIEFPQAYSKEYKDYLNSIAYVDRYLRDVYAVFADAGLLDSTVWVVLGDHGESFGEHGPRQHLGQSYEEVLRIPAVVVAPGRIAPGQRIAGLRQQIDVFPTILDLLGIEVTGGRLPGVSLLSEASSERSLFFNGVYEGSTLAMRRGSLKYLYNYDQGPFELYDLGRDPGETKDIAETLPPPALAEVEAELLRWSAEVRGALLRPHSEGSGAAGAPRK